MDAIEKSWSAELTAKLNRQLMRVQAEAVARVKNDNGSQMAQQCAARTAVNELFNNRSENKAILLGVREAKKMNNLIDALRALNWGHKNANNSY